MTAKPKEAVQSRHHFHKLQKIAVDNDVDEDAGFFTMIQGLLPADPEGQLTAGQMVMRMLRTGAYSSTIFARLALNDASRRKVSYCLGFFSVFLVVLIAALMFTTLGNLQILFLRLGEADSGEMDLILKSGGQVEAANSLNYTAVRRLFPDGDGRSFHTARTILAAGDVRIISPWTTAGSVGHCNNAGLQALTDRSSAAVAPVAWGVGNATQPAMERCLSASCALFSLCTSAAIEHSVDIFFMDTDREKRMGLGSRWPHAFPSDPEQAAIMDDVTAAVLQLQVGDRFLAVVAPSYALMQAYESAEMDDLYDVFRTIDPSNKPQFTSSNIAVVSLRLHAIASSNYDKLTASESRFIFLPFASVNDVIGRGLNPRVSTTAQRAAFRSVPANDVASRVIFNLPPQSRSATYTQTSADRIRTELFAFAGTIVGPIGFNQVEVSTPIMDFIFANRFFSLFLGLILSIIITALSFLSIVLIYSLLNVSVESRMFELGVLRMLGFTRPNLTGLVLTNAMFFALPAWAFGLVLGQLVYLALRSFLDSLLGVLLPPLLAGDAVGFATLAGLGIPLAAAIAPVMSVLTQSLPDALNTERGRTKAVDYKIEREEDGYLSFTAIGMGLCLSVFAFLIYYLFPLALLTFNISLLFFIFFGVLLGMLGGLILLAVNFERFAETVMQYVFLFWEKDAVFTLIEKNLTAHRPRNRKTTLMYALTLGFIIFITVAFQIQLISISYQVRRSMGNEVLATAKDMTFSEGLAIDDAISQLHAQGLVKHWAWDSEKYSSQGFVTNVTMDTLGRYETVFPTVRAVSPNFWLNTDESFLIINEEDTSSGRSLGERVYSREGSAQFIMPTSYKTVMALDSLQDRFSVNIVARNVDGDEFGGGFTALPAAFLDASPVMTFSKFPTATVADAAMSAPAMVAHSFGALRSIENMGFNAFSVGVNGGKDVAKKVAVAIASRVASVRGKAKVSTYYDSAGNLETAASVVNFFFIFTQIMAMLICFFALLSSMSTNVLYQAKEIGVLRCLGLRRFATYRIYVWEAYILVTAASILGLIVGTAVAYTMMLQNSLFTQLPLPFTFPYLQLIVIVGTSAVCAFFASYGPVKALLSAPSITHIMRRTV